MILVDRAARTQAGIDNIVSLAEALQAPVVDLGGRMNFPTRHALNQSARQRGLISEADVILALEVADLWGAVHSFRDQLHRTSRSLIRPGTKLINIAVSDLYMKSNYQDIERYPEVDLDIAADPEATLPSLVDAIKRQTSADRRRRFQDRGAKLAANRQEDLEAARLDASCAWDASPMSMGHMCAELGAVIENEDWSLSSFIGPVGGWPMSGWPLRLWSFEKHYQFIGGSGAVGIGYNAPASVGAALAKLRDRRRTQCDDQYARRRAPGMRYLSTRDEWQGRGGKIPGHLGTNAVW